MCVLVYGWHSLGLGISEYCLCATHDHSSLFSILANEITICDAYQHGKCENCNKYDKYDGYEVTFHFIFSHINITIVIKI